ncbi:hypothetical protein BGX23_010134 [Mortierella sp. AD031]|nr:hypothetical protein BGX23_010134 [Mortierella sp. AD031]
MKIHFLSLLLVATTALASSGTDGANPATSHPERRTLLGDESSYRNQVDNSRGKQVFRVDHIGDSSVRKGLLLYDDLQRRSLLGDLLGGGDSTSIENYNDNSKHSKTMNSHGNTHTTITKIHKAKGSSETADRWNPHDFFDHRAEESILLNRRGLLWGGSATTISNVNDNSKHTKTYNSHGNKSKKITKVVTKDSSRGRRRGGDDDDDFQDSWSDKREDKEDELKANVVDTKPVSDTQSRPLYKFDHIKPQSTSAKGEPSSVEKRDTTTTLTTTTAIVEFDDNNDSETATDIKVDTDLTRRNLVTIQIVTQNTNGQTIDNSSVYPVKVIQGPQQQPRRHSKNKRPVHASNYKSRPSKHKKHSSKSSHQFSKHTKIIHATKSDQSKHKKPSHSDKIRLN